MGKRGRTKLGFPIRSSECDRFLFLGEAFSGHKMGDASLPNCFLHTFFFFVKQQILLSPCGINQGEGTVFLSFFLRRACLH